MGDISHLLQVIAFFFFKYQGWLVALSMVTTLQLSLARGGESLVFIAAALVCVLSLSFLFLFILLLITFLLTF